MLTDDITRMKKILREEECQFFTDDDLRFYINENDGNINDAIHQCLILKAEDSTISITGLNSADTSKYFLRLAQRYRRNNSGTLQ